MATFLFYVVMSYGGNSAIQVVPMPSPEVCNQVKDYMVNHIANEKVANPFAFSTDRAMIPFRPECKTF